MLHLFNNVFVEQEKYINLLEAPDIIVVSADYKLDPINVSENVSKTGTNIDEILGESTMQQWFADLISKTTKVVIYADNDSFAKIASTWLKSSTNMDADSYNLFVDCYGFHIKSSSKTNNELVTKLKDAFAGAETLNLSGIDYKPSFEFLFASALHDINFAKKAKLVTLISKFLKRYYEETILEIRREIDVHALSSNLQTVLGGSGKNLSNLNTLPDMAVFAGDYWKDEVSVASSKSYLPGTNSKIDLSKATDAEVNALVAVVKKVRLAIMEVSEEDIHANLVYDTVGSYTYINTVKNGDLDNTQFNTVLSEMIDKNIDILNVPNDLVDSIVNVFLSHVKSLKKASDFTALQKFTLK